MRRRVAVTVLGLGCLFLLPATVRAETDATVSFQEIEESLTCQCGCGLTVHSCNHLQCPSALPLRAEIREQMATGKNKEAVLAYFKEKYGEKILSAPTTEGFNLLAWITPFILFGAGALFVALTARHWVGRRTPVTAPQQQEQPPQSQYDAVLDKELKDFDA